MYSYSNKIRFIAIILFSFLYRPISVDSIRSVFLFHILNDRIQRCSIFSKIGFAVKITDVNSDVCKIHSDFRSGIICFIFFYRGLS